MCDVYNWDSQANVVTIRITYTISGISKIKMGPRMSSLGDGVAAILVTDEEFITRLKIGIANDRFT